MSVSHKEHNTLFPVFLKLETLTTLVVGGGNVALEKLTAIFSNSPEAKIRLVAKEINPDVRKFLTEKNISFEERSFHMNDTKDIDLAIIAINDKTASKEIHDACASKKILTNVADTPDYCDFYLGSIVQKGNLKIAVSTNGKSPTIAKRVKDVLNEAFPSEIDDVLNNMEKIRNSLAGNFSDKVKQLNDITTILAVKTEPETTKHKKTVQTLLFSGAAICLMVLGHLLFSYFTLDQHVVTVTDWFSAQITEDLLLYMLGGFIAQMIDGALGMAYGVSATTFLLSFGITPAAASASVHTSEIFTSGVSGLMHLKFGNVNNKLFKNLLLPGIVGAILGAYILSSLEEYSYVLKPIVAAYTMILGIIIIRKAIKGRSKKKKTKHIGVLALFGGFLDAIGGGGWGPIVTSTLIANGRNARYTIGSVNLAEFFVAFSSSVTFILFIGLSHFQVILGLVLGGMIAAPIAARLSSKLPVKTIMLAVGIVIIIVSIRIILLMLWPYL